MGLLPISGGALDVSGTPSSEDVAAVTVNLRNGGVSEYTNYPFTSLVMLGGNYYGLTATGAYQLVGDTDSDTDVDSAFLTGITAFPSERSAEVELKNKRVDSVYMNARIYDGDGGAVRARVNESEDRLYNSPGVAGYAEGLAPVRVKFGKGLKGRNWQIGYENRGGSNFEFERFDARYVILSRGV